MLTNLVGNAVKFTHSGEVTVAVGGRQEEPDRAVLEFSVRDTGIGIPSDKISKIFTLFEQGDGSTSRRYGGTGLGLAIAARLVELMGGKILVESQPGAGSTFSFTVRLAIQGGPAEGASGGGLLGCRALVVADHGPTRGGLRNLLATKGVETTAAGTAELGGLRGESGPAPFDFAVLAGPRGLHAAAAVGRIRKALADPLLPIILAFKPGELAPGDVASLPARSARVMIPVRQQELASAALDLLDGRQAEPGCREQSRTAERRSLQVLLVEDNEVNRLLFRELLEKAGHRVKEAWNGRDAVERFGQAAFDVILMDVQMPVMDGIEATAAIRRIEAGTGRRTPILALSAHALAEAQQSFLEAGMDGCLVKPIKIESFVSDVERATDQIAKRSEERRDAGTAGEVRDPAWMPDAGAVLKLAGNDLSLLRRLVDLFFETWPERFDRLQAAARTGNAGVLASEAHGLVSAVGIFCAPGLVEILRQIESSARKGDLAGVPALVGAAGRGIAALKAELEERILRQAPPN